MFVLNLVTPEKKLLTDAEVEEVIVPAYKGQLDILPGHAPLMSTLGTGVLKYRLKGAADYEKVVVSWGYLQVNFQGVTVLAEIAESLEELDRARSEAALKKAQTQLMEPILEPDQIHKLQNKVARAQARLEALGADTTGGSTH
jgi:F-type H+-transporting ATPase subunit epsilon